MTNQLITYRLPIDYSLISFHSKWFEPRSISSSYRVIVWVRVVVKRTVVGDWHFDNLSGSHLQSQWIVFVSRWCYKVGLLNWPITFTDQLYNIIDWQILFTWLWRWLPLRLSKRQSPTTVLFATTLTQTITQYKLLISYVWICLKHSF